MRTLLYMVVFFAGLWLFMMWVEPPWTAEQKEMDRQCMKQAGELGLVYITEFDGGFRYEYPESDLGNMMFFWHMLDCLPEDHPGVPRYKEGFRKFESEFKSR